MKQMIASNKPANEGVAAPTTGQSLQGELSDSNSRVTRRTWRCANCESADQDTDENLLDECCIYARIDHRNRAAAVIAGLHG